MKRILETLKRKWPEYLLEVLVITIGILGAFTLNNWNESRKDRIVEQEIIVQLLEEYQTNLTELENKIDFRNIIINSSIDLLGYIDEPININKDSLIRKIAVIRYDPTFDPIKNDLISSGNIRLIQNIELRKLLSNWSSDVVALQEMEQQWQKIRSETNVPYLISLGVYRDIVNLNFNDLNEGKWLLDNFSGSVGFDIDVGKSTRTQTAEALLNEKELESMMAHAINFNTVTNVQSMNLKNRINEILILLEAELDND